jgi:F0F1-type ATP synthase beta subunit
MIEFENVKDALKEAIEIVDVKGIKTKTGTGESHLATAEEIQSLLQERLYNIADLLGMSDLYLDDENDEVHD